jgi:hypothetical protein
MTPSTAARGTASDGRDETAEERRDRNWADLLQELRVTQTGVQLIAGFLLTLPFTDRFWQISTFDRRLYLVLVLLAGLVIGLTLAPIAIHRRLFGEHVKERLVLSAHRIMHGVLAGIVLLISGITLLIFDIVTDRALALTVALLMLLTLTGLVVVLPAYVARHRPG